MKVKINSIADYRKWLALRFFCAFFLPFVAIFVVLVISVATGMTKGSSSTSASPIVTALLDGGYFLMLFLAWPRKAERNQVKANLARNQSLIKHAQQKLVEETAAAERKAEAKKVNDAKAAVEEAGRTALSEKKRKEKEARLIVEQRLKFVERLTDNTKGEPAPSGLVLHDGERYINSWRAVLYGPKKGKTKATRVTDSVSNKSSSSVSSHQSSGSTVSVRRGGYGGATLRVSPRVSVNRGSFGSGGASQSYGSSSGQRSSSSTKTGHFESVSTPSRSYVYVDKVDEGMFTLTNQGLLFVGQLKQIEISFSDLAQFFWDEDETIITIVKRKSSAPFNFDIDSDDVLSAGFELNAALRLQQGNIDAFVDQIKNVDDRGRSLDFQTPAAIADPRSNFSEVGASSQADPRYAGKTFSVVIDSVGDIQGFVDSFTAEYDVDAEMVNELLRKLPSSLITGVNFATATDALKVLDGFGAKAHYIIEN